MRKTMKNTLTKVILIALITFSSFLLLTQQSFAATNNSAANNNATNNEVKASDLQQQIQQVITELQQLRKAITKNSDHHNVMLGAQRFDTVTVANFLENISERLQQSLQNIAVYNTKQDKLNLRWQQTNVKAVTDVLNNAYVAFKVKKQPIYICRAQFIGDNVNTTAVYPGQLTKQGCRISYAGYAFTVPKFDILMGKEKLQWQGINTVKQNLGTAMTQEQKELYRKLGYATTGDMYALYRVAPKANLPMLIAGGYQGNHPVYICKAAYKKLDRIGKLVTFIGKGILPQEACDIGVGDKEVVIENNFKLLLTQS